MPSGIYVVVQVFEFRLALETMGGDKSAVAHGREELLTHRRFPASWRRGEVRDDDDVLVVDMLQHGSEVRGEHEVLKVAVAWGR
jgi:hypothetical protein